MMKIEMYHYFPRYSIDFFPEFVIFSFLLLQFSHLRGKLQILDLHENDLWKGEKFFPSTVFSPMMYCL